MAILHTIIIYDDSLPLSSTSHLLSSFPHLFSWASADLLSYLLSSACSLDEVQSVLKNAGFSRVKSIEQLEGHTFCQDPHCRDILVFPAQLKAQLCSTKLLSDHKLIIQVRAAQERRFLTRGAYSL